MQSKPETKTRPEADLQTVREKAVELLARREHTRLELTRKLRQRELPSHLIETALDELASENLLSEARYAEALVASRIDRGFGPLRILSEAQDAGADEGRIRLAMEAAQADWLELAREAQRKRFGRPPKDFNERVKQSRFLASRGFSAETVRSLLGDMYD